MKKVFFFLTVFLFFGLVIAEEVQVGEYTIEDETITLFEEREPEAEPEKEPEVEKQEEEVQLGFDAFMGFHPDLTVAVGYRF